jgi:CRP-like cAMP-binding protein
MVYVLKIKARSSDQIKFLSFQTEEIKFFKDIIVNFGREYQEQCCESMTYQFFEKDTFVFEKGKCKNKKSFFSLKKFFYTLPLLDMLGKEFFIILKGEVSVLMPKKIELKTDGKRKTEKNGKDNNNFFECRVLYPGESFGEIALIENRLRTASVKCREDSHFAVLDKSNFRRILCRFTKNIYERDKRNKYFFFYVLKWMLKKLS